jgi:long-chain fatty acid transport protein
LRSVSRFVVASALLCGAASPALASGFYLQEQSAKEEGRAFSGGAASADDASTIFFNPAGMTELDPVEVSLNTAFLFVDSQQTDTGSTRTYPGVPTPVAIGGSDGGKPFKQPVLVPTGFVSFRVGSAPVWLGLGITAPFGLKDQYSADFFGRYDSTGSDVKTINIQPSIAIKVSDAISIGGGVDVQQIDVQLDSALPNVSPAFGDGHLTVKGDDLSVGWNAGVMLRAGAFRLGAHYRSQMKHNLNGRYTVTGLAGPLAGSNTQRFATAPIVLPDSATISAMYGVGQRFRIMATGKWFNWSVFDEIAIYPLGAPAAISVQNYKDAWSGALGVEYDVSPKLTLRAGSMYDTTPTQDGFRTTRVPDGDRTWASAGATYKMSRHVEVNLSYAHIFVSEETLNRTDTLYAGTAAATTATVRSTNSGNADIIATSLALKF